MKTQKCAFFAKIGILITFFRGEGVEKYIIEQR